jgi:hypothetical protein
MNYEWEVIENSNRSADKIGIENRLVITRTMCHESVSNVMSASSNGRIQPSIITGLSKRANKFEIHTKYVLDPKENQCQLQSFSALDTSKRSNLCLVNF